MPITTQQNPQTFFARYHISDLRAVLDSIRNAGLSEHFFIENPGKREDGTVAENTFAIYTDLVRPNATELIKKYQNFGLRRQLGLIISIKV